MTIISKFYVKDPQAKLNYGFDWDGESPGPWLATGATISTSTWTVPAAITKVSDPKTTTTTTIVLSGGTVGEKYVLTNHIVASDAQEDDRSMQVEIRER
jgi:hypothetical protein